MKQILFHLSRVFLELCAILAVCSLVFLVLIKSARASELEVGIGATHILRTNGNWYQEGFPNSGRYTEPSLAVGITGEANKYIQWHLDYSWMGRFTEDATALTNDANYSTSTRNCVGPCGPTARFLGHGKLHEVSAVADIKPFAPNPWSLGFRVGPTMFICEWKEFISGWTAKQGDKPVNVVTSSGCGHKLGAVIGAVLSRDNETLTLDWHYDKCRPNPDACLWDRGTVSLVYWHKF